MCIAEILLRLALNTNQSNNQSINQSINDNGGEAYCDLGSLSSWESDQDQRNHEYHVLFDGGGVGIVVFNATFNSYMFSLMC